MHIYQIAAWSVITALSLMLVGGLVMWAYGERVPRQSLKADGLEAEATQVFHLRLSRWFFTYGLVMIVSGIGLLLWAGSYFLKD